DCGASFATTPSCFVRAADSPALKSLMRQAMAIERDDVVVTVPVAVAWLRDGPVDQLAAVLERIPHPKAVILGGQRDPLSNVKNGPRNLRRLVRDIAEISVWRTDLAAFDTLVHGGLGGSIGAGG